MKVVIAGSTGMIGSLILEQRLNSERITTVISLVRKRSAQNHQKLTEIVIPNFEKYSGQDGLFKNVAIGFFCIGVYTGQVTNDTFKKITVDNAVEFARVSHKNSPKATLCLLSGAGADRTEKSRTAFARFKGMAENQIAALGINFYSFRPSYIYPVRPRKEPNIMYRIIRKLYPVIKLFGKNASISSTDLANAMMNVAMNGAEREIFENREILKYVT